MNGAGIRLGGPSCAKVNFGMHVITRTKKTKLLGLTIRPGGEERRITGLGTVPP